LVTASQQTRHEVGDICQRPCNNFLSFTNSPTNPDKAQKFLQNEPPTLGRCYFSVVYYTLAMKTHSKIFHINPLGRDLVLLIILGMFIALTLVTAGMILVNQF